MESEGEGFTIYWKIENISLVLGKSCLEIEFNWPHLEKRCEFTLNIKPFWIDNFYMAIEKKRCFGHVNGTISAKIGEGSVYDVEKFDNWNTSVEKLKYVNLLNLANLFANLNFQKDVLEFRIHLWNNNGTTKIERVQYYFRSTIFNQKFSLPWTIKSEVDANLQEVFLNYTTDLPIDILNKLANIIFFPRLSLQFRNFLTSSATCHAELDAFNDMEHIVILRCLLTVEDGEKKQVTFGETLEFVECIGVCNIPICMPVEELKARKAEFYPDGILCVTCNFTVFCAPSFLERVHWGFDDNHLNWQIDDAENFISKSVVENMTLKDSMFILYKDGKLCDVSLRSGDANFPCHKIVLCARSPVFTAMFDNDMREKESSVVNIDDVDPHTLGLFLDCLYTDSSAVMNWETALNLYAVSDKYEVTLVSRRCAAYIQRNISLSNVCEVLILADRHQDHDLKRAAQYFFTKHAKKIVDSPEYVELMQHNIVLAAEIMRDALIKN